MVTENTNHDELDLLARLEALLFVAPGMVTKKQLASALEISTREIEQGLDRLQKTLEGRGIRLQIHRGEIQLTSAPEAGELVHKFLELEATSRLSKAALETLAIIAYEQPVTRPHIDSIRGVNSDGVMRTLISKELTEEAGRAEGPGRPILYITTPEFLGHFGLASLDELPQLELPETESITGGETARQLLKD